MLFIVESPVMRLSEKTHVMRLYKYTDHRKKRNRKRFALLLNYSLKITPFLYCRIHPISQKLL